MRSYRFAVDSMLGRLARWLRLMGHDTLYDPHLRGRVLERRAEADGRIILTRDRALCRLTHHPCCFIESDHFREQVQQVLHTFELTHLEHLFTRCVHCNCAVVPIAKEQIAGRVPPYVFATQTCFAWCPNCRRVFWPGTHVTRVREELGRMGFGRGAPPS